MNDDLDEASISNLLSAALACALAVSRALKDKQEEGPEDDSLPWIIGSEKGDGERESPPR
jgi:hypothetical protein